MQSLCSRWLSPPRHQRGPTTPSSNSRAESVRSGRTAQTIHGVAAGRSLPLACPIGTPARPHITPRERRAFATERTTARSFESERQGETVPRASWPWLRARNRTRVRRPWRNRALPCGNHKLGCCSGVIRWLLRVPTSELGRSYAGKCFSRHSSRALADPSPKTDIHISAPLISRQYSRCEITDDINESNKIAVARRFGAAHT